MSKRRIAVALFALLVGSLTFDGQPSRAYVPDRKAVDAGEVEKLVFFAVLEGCYSDGVSNEAVDIILGVDAKRQHNNMTEHFVQGCPLCHPAYDALVLYRSRVQFYGRKSGADTFGRGLDGVLLKKLHSTDKTERLQVIQKLVDTWVRRRLDMMRLNKDERAEWTLKIEEGRQVGMKNLKADPVMMDRLGCPICDGAADACKTRQ